MKKVQFAAMFWTLLIAIPFTALALMASAYISDHLIALSTSLAFISQSLLMESRDLILEAEVTGMVAGVVLVLAITFATYLLGHKEQINGTTK